MDTDSMFSQVKRYDRLSDRVQAQLQNLILGQKLKPGDRLPPERELAEALGVSRTVVREAIRSLTAMGLLEVRSGSGMFVRTLPSKTVTDSINLFFKTHELNEEHIYEVRRSLEVDIAGFAAQRATPEDVDALMKSVEAISQTHLTPEQFAEEDVGFHSLLARATQNDLYQLLLDSIAGIMREVRLVGFALPDTQKQAIHFHQMIAERVEAGDVNGAREAMAKHLDESVDTFTRAKALK